MGYIILGFLFVILLIIFCSLSISAKNKKLFNILSLFKVIFLIASCLGILYIIVVSAAIKNDDSMLMGNIVLGLMITVPSIILYILIGIFGRTYRKKMNKH